MTGGISQSRERPISHQTELQIPHAYITLVIIPLAIHSNLGSLIHFFSLPASLFFSSHNYYVLTEDPAPVSPILTSPHLTHIVPYFVSTSSDGTHRTANAGNSHTAPSPHRRLCRPRSSSRTCSRSRRA
ncbi:hypothetical protein K505DRAFT_52739 [Melanomma pulvis-pyrius CBS 109.77]|uniref:Uncharacterized protein n=1 Tax=Melanomma pulvis-pyrius CBS 109.77 TaxID=1314802 RepID=A0A6A6XT71_9PLEO|nr:hypothetical protein K505DRAFT_52739 [Melanomma pulvis-pyrius CBS 109.77]